MPASATNRPARSRRSTRYARGFLFAASAASAAVVFSMANNAGAETIDKPVAISGTAAGAATRLDSQTNNEIKDLPDNRPDPDAPGPNRPDESVVDPTTMLGPDGKPLDTTNGLPTTDVGGRPLNAPNGPTDVGGPDVGDLGASLNRDPIGDVLGTTKPAGSTSSTPPPVRDKYAPYADEEEGGDEGGGTPPADPEPATDPEDGGGDDGGDVAGEEKKPKVWEDTHNPDGTTKGGAGGTTPSQDEINKRNTGVLDWLFGTPKKGGKDGGTMTDPDATGGGTVGTGGETPVKILIAPKDPVDPSLQNHIDPPTKGDLPSDAPLINVDPDYVAPGTPDGVTPPKLVIAPMDPPRGGDLGQNAPLPLP